MTELEDQLASQQRELRRIEAAIERLEAERRTLRLQIELTSALIMRARR